MVKMQRNHITHTLLVGMQNNTGPPKNKKFLYKLDIRLPYILPITLMGIYPSERKTYVYIKTCTQMLIAALYL